MSSAIDTKRVRAMIARAYDGPDAREAIREIEEIWAELLACADMAEARVRILLPRVEKPVLADTPYWLPFKLCELRETVTIDEATVRSTEMLIRAVCHAIPDMPVPLIGPGPFSSVEVAWGQNLLWIVYEPRLGWPGVNARAYAGDPFEATPIHHAAGVIEHAKNALKM